MPASPQTLTLCSFDDSAAGIVRALRARVSRSNDALQFRYTLDAKLGRVHVPERRAPRRVDELWKHTCFEAFIRAPADGPYVELNFAPSTEWAAYAFDRYREGMRPIEPLVPPRVQVDAAPECLQLDVHIETRALLASIGQPCDTRLLLSLSAVIEADEGTRSYWALKHAASRPDFHDPAGFILEV